VSSQPGRVEFQRTVASLAILARMFSARPGAPMLDFLLVERNGDIDHHIVKITDADGPPRQHIHPIETRYPSTTSDAKPRLCWATPSFRSV
jgi:hypothetical protein